MRFPVRLLTINRTVAGTFTTATNEQLGYPETPAFLAPLPRPWLFHTHKLSRNANGTLRVRDTIEGTDRNAGDVRYD